MITWLPIASDEVVNVAVPPKTLAVPKVAAPSRKVAVPVGVPEPGATGLTVAEKITDCPNTDGLAEETTEVVVDDWLTISVNAADVLARKFVSPL